MSRKLEILSAIEAYLREIKVVNNYKTDIGNNVFYWRDLPFEYGEVGAVTYRDPEQEITQNNLYHENSLSVEIEAIAFADNLLVTGTSLESDLIAAIKVDPSWGGKALFTRLLTIEKSVETNGKTAIRLIMTISINYRNKLWEDS